MRLIILPIVLILLIGGCSSVNSPASCPQLDCNACAGRTTNTPVTNSVITDKTPTVIINSNWDISENKGELIGQLNKIMNPVGFNNAVKVTKMTVTGDIISISYTQVSTDYRADAVGQTMFTILEQTANYLKKNDKTNYDIEITATTSNGGHIFYKKTSKADISKILNYDIGMDEWIATITQRN